MVGVPVAQRVCVSEYFMGAGANAQGSACANQPRMRQHDGGRALGDRRDDTIGRNRAPVVGRNAACSRTHFFPRFPDVGQRWKLEGFVHDFVALGCERERRCDCRLQDRHVRSEIDRVCRSVKDRADTVGDFAHFFQPARPRFGAVRGPIIEIARKFVARGQRRCSHRVADQPRVRIESGKPVAGTRPGGKCGIHHCQL